MTHRHFSTRFLAAACAVALLAFAGQAFSQLSPDESAINACYTPAGTLYLIGQPGLKEDCSGPHTPIALQAAGAGLGLSVQIRTKSQPVPANSSGQASLTVECEPGEVALSGGGRVLLNGNPTIVSWVAFDRGDWPVGDTPTGWVVSYAFSASSTAVTAEAWVSCAS